MALFPKTDPAAKRQRELDARLKAARASRDALIDRRKTAEASAATHREKARALAAEGADDTALSAVETAMRREQDRFETLTGAISDIDATIASLDRELAQIVDQRCRAETAAAIGTLVEKFTAADAAFAKAVGELADLVRESALIVPDAEPLKIFLDAVREQVPPATSQVTEVLRGHAKAVLSGTAPASLPKPAPVVSSPVVTAPATKRLFTLRAVKWKAGGRLQVADQYVFVDLPLEQAGRALQRNACVAPTDRRCAELNGVHGNRHPNPDRALDLDEPVGSGVYASPQSDVLITADFRRIDRSADERVVAYRESRV